MELRVAESHVSLAFYFLVGPSVGLLLVILCDIQIVWKALYGCWQ